MKTAVLELDEEYLDVSKFLLHRATSFSVRNDLMDMGVYILSNWIVQMIVTTDRISSLRTDLLPYLLQLQFQPINHLITNIPALAQRNRPLVTLEPWLVSMQAPNRSHVSETTLDMANQETSDPIRLFGLVYDPLLLLDPTSTTSSGGTAVTSSSSSSSSAGGSSGSGSSSAGQPSTNTSIIFTKLTNISSYMTLNK
jgi:uncharacterized membrane protein YgcG